MHVAIGSCEIKGLGPRVEYNDVDSQKGPHLSDKDGQKRARVKSPCNDNLNLMQRQDCELQNFPQES